MMIIVRLQGGLGNQMFQYAAGARLANIHQTPLYLDLSWFARPPRGVTKRRYSLTPFVIDARLNGEAVLRRSGLALGGRAGAALERLLAKVPGNLTVLHEGRIAPCDVLHAPNNTVLIGYWQAEVYFADAKELIRGSFTWRNPPAARNRAFHRAIERERGSCAIHVRRGDYISDRSTNSTHGLLPADYYMQAAETIGERVASPNYYVFSDDPKWCRDHFHISSPFNVISSNDGDSADEDLRLMRLCRHHIIANSSLSWWGAWLGQKSGSVVVAPQQWFKDDELNGARQYPRSWLTI